MQFGRHSFYCTLELSCPHDNLSAIPPATKVAGFLASFYEEDRRDGRKKFREALARLERKRPDDFENAGDENVCPGHDVCLPAGPSPLMYERLRGSSRTAASERFSLRDSEAPEW